MRAKGVKLMGGPCDGAKYVWPEDTVQEIMPLPPGSREYDYYPIDWDEGLDDAGYLTANYTEDDEG